MEDDTIQFLKKEANLLHSELPFNVRNDRENSKRAIFKRLKRNWIKGITLDSFSDLGRVYQESQIVSATGELAATGAALK